jgi:serine/threonine-protein kinase
MKCAQCGTLLDDSARFCGVCGARLSGLSAPAAPPKSDPAKVAVSPQAFRPQTPAPLPPPPKVVPPPQAPPSIPPATARPSDVNPNAKTIAGKPAMNRDPFIGTLLNNRYQVEEKVGQGGFGAVYKARQVAANREVALKVLHPDMARDQNLVARFRREGAVACNLRDAHTVTTYDFDQTADGTLYIAMELLKGRSLHDVFYEESPIHWLRVLKILEQMSSSLGEAHKMGIVHRDIKPENIYLENRHGNKDYVKILDFGIAKIIGGDFGQQSSQLTAIGQTLGTLEYMSPEQLMGKQLDGRSDVYAMGVLGYELMTGNLPFPDAQGPAELIAAQLKKTPRPPSAVATDAGIPPEADEVILRMLEKDRNKRFADCEQLAAALTQVIAVHSGGFAGMAYTPPPVTPPPVTPPPMVMPQPNTPPPGMPFGAPLPPPLPPMAIAAAGPTPVVAPARPAPSAGRRFWLWLVLGSLVIGAAAAGVYFGVIHHP